MADNRRRLLFVKKFFEEYTDEEHAATMYDIISYLKRCGIEAERKAITEDIYALQAFGMDIQLDEKGKCRKLIERELEVSEIKMIIDCLASSKILTEKKSNELIGKFGNLVSMYQRRYLERQVVVACRAKSATNKIFYNVDAINTAIMEGSNISFQYYQYNMKKERVYKHGGKIYHVNPCYLIYENNVYYLLGDEGNEFKTFRVDRMDNVTIEEAEYSKRGNKISRSKIDLDSFSKSTFGMYHGYTEKVTMLFKKEMMDTVLDRFGEDVDVEQVDEEHFRIKVDVKVSPQFFGWVFGLGENVMIEYPLKVAKQMKDMLQEMQKAYREEHSRNIYYYNRKQKNRSQQKNEKEEGPAEED